MKKSTKLSEYLIKVLNSCRQIQNNNIIIIYSPNYPAQGLMKIAAFLLESEMICM